MFTDIVGYTAMMGRDENKAIEIVTHHKKVIEHIVPEFEGDLIQFYGDGSLSIYPSATVALECAMAIQTEFQKDIKIPLRIGLHIGELLIRDGNVYGDGVNLASRIESMGQAGTIMFSEDVFQKIRNNNLFKTQRLGEFEFKNVVSPMSVHVLTNEGFAVPEKDSLNGKFKSSKEKKNVELSDKPLRKVVDKSVAVLPFVNMSSDPEQEFFCEGISEEIINTICQLPNLKVAGRTSSFCFKGKNEDLRTVGNVLGVSKILEGSVRKSGNRFRITAQLVEASTGFHLWSRRYDRESDDVFKIQDEISLEIANQLEITLSGTESMPKSREQTKSIEAYQLYYKGRSFFYQRGMSLFKGLKCFQEALEIDPHYSLAHSGLADTYVMLAFHGYITPPECWDEAIPAAQEALKYGVDLGETHNTLGVIALLHDRNFEEAEKEFKKAMEINPSHKQARVWYAMIYLAIIQEKFKEGFEEFKVAIENDPLSSYVHCTYALTLATGDKFEEAIASGEYAVEMDPESWIARYCLGYCYLWSGQLDKALKECHVALKISSRHAWSLHLIALTYLKMKRRDLALKIFEEMEARYRDHYLPPSNLAIVAAALGKEEYALELAIEAIDIVDPYLPFIVTIFKDGEAIQKIKGFDKIKERVGFPLHI